MFTDTHTHLYSEEFNIDRTQLIEKAIKNGVTKFYLPNIDSTSINGMIELTKQFPTNCFAMMGLHPCSVAANVNDELEIIKPIIESHMQKALPLKVPVEVGMGVGVNWLEAH